VEGEPSPEGRTWPGEIRVAEPPSARAAASLSLPRGGGGPQGRDPFPLPACGESAGAMEMPPAPVTLPGAAAAGSGSSTAFHGATTESKPHFQEAPLPSVPSFSSVPPASHAEEPCLKTRVRVGGCSDFQPGGCTSWSSCLAGAVLTRCLTGTKLRAHSHAADCRNSQPASERRDGRKPRSRPVPGMAKWSSRENGAGEVGTKEGSRRNIHITWQNATAEVVRPLLLFLNKYCGHKPGVPASAQ